MESLAVRPTSSDNVLKLLIRHSTQYSTFPAFIELKCLLLLQCWALRPVLDDLRMIHLENDADNLLHPAREP